MSCMENKIVKNRKKAKSFRHLKQFDRDRIQAMLDSGHNQEEIAGVINFDAGALSREINGRKTKDGKYIALVAERKANIKRSFSKHQGMKIEKHPDMREYIIKGLIAYRSPDEIAGRMKKAGAIPRVGAKAIYKWLYSQWGQRYCHLLCTKRYKRKTQKRNKTKIEMIPNRISIRERPVVGIHAEGDLFVSPIKTGTQRSGMLIVIPSSKLFVGKMIENKKPSTMRLAVNEKLQCFNADDLTMDNGMENREHEQFDIDAYFCDTHSPWQKPHVEGGIGLVRRWFIKKKTDLKTVSNQEYQSYLHILNNKWRKSLGYKSAYEVSLERGIIIQKTPAFSGVMNLRKVAFQGKI